MQCRPLAGHPHLPACMAWRPDPSGKAPSTSALVGVRFLWVLVWRVLPPLPHLKRNGSVPMLNHPGRLPRAGDEKEQEGEPWGTPWPRGSDLPGNAHQSEQCLSQLLRHLIQKGWLCHLSGLHTHVQTQNMNASPEGPWTNGPLTSTTTISPACAKLTQGPLYLNTSSFNPVLLPTLQRCLSFSLSNTWKEFPQGIMTKTPLSVHSIFPNFLTATHSKKYISISILVNTHWYMY